MPGLCYFPAEGERSISLGDEKSQEQSMGRLGTTGMCPLQQLGTGLFIIQQGFELGFPQNRLRYNNFEQVVYLGGDPKKHGEKNKVRQRRQKVTKGALWEMFCYSQQSLYPGEDLLRHSGTCHSVVPLRCEGTGSLLIASLPHRLRVVWRA